LTTQKNDYAWWVVSHTLKEHIVCEKIRNEISCQLTYDDPPKLHNHCEMSLLHTCGNMLEMVMSYLSQIPSNGLVMDYAWKIHDNPSNGKHVK
jgi:hypothetical protein